MAEAVDEVAVFILRVGLVVQRSMHEAIESSAEEAMA
jgi:hypothetical protein